MNQHRTFMVPASEYECARLLAEWQWLVPVGDTPLQLTALGDWLFGKRDGSLWLLSMLEGTYVQVARTSDEFNVKNKSADWLKETFLTDWFELGMSKGIVPDKGECIGWKVHPIIGGKLEATNLQVFSMLVYQSLMGQLHRQLQARPEPKKKSWLKLW